MAVPGKQYGLILPQKKGVSKTAALQRPSVFGDDSDDETSVGESLQKEAVKKRMMKQTRLEMQKALEQDSTVYDYDGVYDDIQKQRAESNKKILGGTDRKPKYINQLLKAVEERKKEQERRDERKIQKEREAEGEQFADKEAYVTSAYKQKLQERKEELEREKREAEMEAALDVKKQKDLSGFYRHLLNQTVGEEEIPDRSADKNQSAKALKAEEGTSPRSSPTSLDNVPSSHSDSEEGRDQKTGFSKPGPGSAHSKRQYRQRSPSSGSGEDKEKESERDRDREKKSHRDRGRDRDRERERDRDRDDRHRRRRDDKDRKKEKDRDDDRSRGRRDAGREDRHGKRERSPKERERDRDGDRDKRGNPHDDKGKEKERDKERERRKDSEKGKAAKTEEKDRERKEGAGEEAKEKPGEETADKEAEAAAAASKFAKRSSDQTVTSARERYLARQMARSACKTYIEKEED